MNDLEPDNVPLNFLWQIGEGRKKITTNNVFVLVRKRDKWLKIFYSHALFFFMGGLIIIYT
jgi:polyferredoxin